MMNRFRRFTDDELEELRFALEFTYVCDEEGLPKSPDVADAGRICREINEEIERRRVNG